jgi:hypothetical protein
MYISEFCQVGGNNTVIGIFFSLCSALFAKPLNDWVHYEKIRLLANTVVQCLLNMLSIYISFRDHLETKFVWPK